MDKSSKATNFEDSLGPTRMINEAHEVVNKKAKERKKSLLYLIHQYLKDEGYHEAALTLQEETQLSPHYCVCDNIDLGNIIQEYEAYYYLRYQKYPKLYRQQVMIKDSVGDARRMCKSAKANFTKTRRGRQTITNSKEDLSEKSESLGSDLLTIQSLFPKDNAFQEALPLHISASSEMQELADIISREIVTTNLNVQWSDVIGLDQVKSVLRETVVYPLKYPGLFHGLLTPWKAVLLYGPPGTGKTMLAKAVASECQTTFFNISSSSIVSKWRGESEKLVKVLFELARHHAPSTIFIDELDAIACRSGSEDHEGSRRLRAELLIHLDGLVSTSQANVFLLATTNKPWDLDQSMLRRFEKRILVDVPNLQDRETLIKHLLPSTLPHKHGFLALTCTIDYKHAAQITEGYTGSDLKVACRETAMSTLRQVLNHLEAGGNGSMRGSKPCKLRPVVTHDLEEALKRTKPTTVNLLSRYHAWEKELGSV